MRILLYCLFIFTFSCKENNTSTVNNAAKPVIDTGKEIGQGCDFFYFEMADSEDRGDFLEQHGSGIDKIIMAKYDSFRTLNTHEVENTFMILDLDKDKFNPFYVYAVDQMGLADNHDTFLEESFADYYFDFFATQPCSFYEHLQSKNTLSYNKDIKTHIDYYFKDLGDPVYKDSIKAVHTAEYGAFYQKQINVVFGD